MKNIFIVLLVLTLFLQPLCASAETIEFTAKSAILMEACTGEVLYELNADDPLPPASVTKIMTILLVMEAIDNGKILLTDKVSISANAANMGGSQVYLEVGEQMTVDELLKCVVVASANDAATALAEYCSGSEEAFVTKMNKRALELGMINTHFENTNGLDDTTENHVTSARDIAIMSKELLKHEKIFDYTTIWMDTIRNGSFGLTNTNRLIRYYKGATGLKTGSTSKAGFCISASAKRNGLHLISVVMGSNTRDDRNQTAITLLDYGFANFTFYENDPEEITLQVLGSTKKQITVSCADPFRKLIAKDKKEKVSFIIELPEYLTSPIQKGDTIGKVIYYLDQEVIGEVEIVAKESARRIEFADLFKILLKKLAIF